MFARSISVIKQYRHNTTNVRKMAGHHAPVHPTEGFEGMVRKVLPHDYQVSQIYNLYEHNLYFIY